MTKKILLWCMAFLIVLLLLFFYDQRSDDSRFVTQSADIDLEIKVGVTSSPIWSITMTLTNVGLQPMTWVKFENTLPAELDYEWNGMLRYVDVWNNYGCIPPGAHPINEGNNDIWSWTLNNIYIAPWQSCTYRVSLVGNLERNKTYIVEASILQTYPTESQTYPTDIEINNSNNSSIDLKRDDLYFSTKWLVYTREKTMDIVSCVSWTQTDVLLKIRSKWHMPLNRLTIQEELPPNTSVVQDSLELYMWPTDRCTPSSVTYQGNKIILDWLNIQNTFEHSTYGDPCIYRFKVNFDKTLAPSTFKNNIQLVDVKTSEDDPIKPIGIVNWAFADYFKCPEISLSWVIFDKQIRRCDDDKGSNCADVSTSDPDEAVTLIDGNYMQYRLHIKNQSPVNIKNYTITDSYVPWVFYGNGNNWDTIDMEYDNIWVPDGCKVTDKGSRGPYFITCENPIIAWEESDIIFGIKKPILVKKGAGFSLTFVNNAEMIRNPDRGTPENQAYITKTLKDYTLLTVWLIQGEWECAWHISVLSTTNLNEYKYSCNGSNNNTYKVDVFDNIFNNIFSSPYPNGIFTVPWIWEYTFYCEIGDFLWWGESKICATTIKWQSDPKQAKYCQDHFKIFVNKSDPYEVSYSCDGTSAWIYDPNIFNNIPLTSLPTGTYTFQNNGLYQLYCTIPNRDGQGNQLTCVQDYNLQVEGFNLSQWIPKVTSKYWWEVLESEGQKKDAGIEWWERWNNSIKTTTPIEKTDIKAVESKTPSKTATPIYVPRR